LLNTINVLPITSRKPGRTVYPNEALLKAGTSGLPNVSIILCHQIRTLDKIRLTNFYGSIENPSNKQEIEEALSFQLDLGNLA
jgi:mRNA interferase MazF